MLPVRRLLIATIVSVLSGAPALSAVCVAACLPAETSHHASAVQPSEADATSEAHHHGHDMSAPTEATGPGVAISSIADGDEDCVCCMTSVATGDLAVVVPRPAVSPHVGPAFVPRTAATLGAGRFAGWEPPESSAGPPARPPVSQSVLRL